MKLCERLEKLYAGAICDAFRELDKKVDLFGRVVTTTHYLHPTVKKCGPVFFTKGKIVLSKEEADELDPKRIEMLKEFPEGGIHYLEVASFDLKAQQVSHYGDITALSIQREGGKGAITDGRLRDLDILRTMTFPIAHNGFSPIDAYGYWMLSDYSYDINFKDPNREKLYAYMSQEGCIFIEENELNDLTKKAEEIAKKEAAVRKDLMTKEALEVYNYYGRW